MIISSDIKGICTVSAMAKKVKLSRPRFYQLIKEGVFPGPNYCAATKRPFYTPDMQQKCLDVRETGIGHNGEYVIFYAQRKKKDTSDQKYQWLINGLKNMGCSVSYNHIKDNISSVYPEGIPIKKDHGIILRDFYCYFKKECKKDV